MQSNQLHQVQRCVMCNGEAHLQSIELEYPFGDVCILVKGVPASVCQQCGEQYVAGDLGVWLGDEVVRLADKIRQVTREERALEGFKLQASLNEGQLHSPDLAPLMA